MGTGENIGERVGLNTGSSGGTFVAADWQLAAGHYEDDLPFTATAYVSQTASDTNPFVIYPRPDSETDNGGSPYARHRWAHPSMDYVIKLNIKGGAFPYNMEVDTGNTHASLIGNITLGATHDAAGSYQVTVPSATIAGLSTLTDYGIYIKVTDQAGDELKIWWSFQKEAAALDHFYFFDNSYAGGSNDGSFAAPFTDLVKIVTSAPGAGEILNTALADKIAVVMEGDSATPGSEYTVGNKGPIDSGAGPYAIIGDTTGATPKIDLNHANPLVQFNGVVHDYTWFNLYIMNGVDYSAATEPGFNDFDGAFISETGKVSDRWSMNNVTFDTVRNWPTVTNGGVTQKNTSYIASNNITGFTRKHFSCVDCVVKNSGSGMNSITDGDCGVNEGAFLHMIGFQHSLLDNLTFENMGKSGSEVACLVFTKRNCRDITFRRWTATTGIYVLAGQYALDIRADNGTSDINDFETMQYTRLNFKLQTGRTSIMALRANANNVTDDGPHYIKFNTMRGGLWLGESTATHHHQSCATAIEVENNVSDSFFATTVDEPNAGTSCTPPTPALANNIESLTDNATNFETDGTLTITGLSGAVRGTRGHEIA